MANTKVQSEQIADGAITAAKIADGAIVASEVADNAITTAKINADAVTGAKIADNAIDSEHYTDGSIDTAHIADAQITVAKMAANSVDSDQYVDGSIDTAHIADAQITVAKMAANSVDSDQYVDGSIDTAHYADNSITGAELADNIDIAGTFDVTGATTLDSTLGVAGLTTTEGVVSTRTGDASQFVRRGGNITTGFGDPLYIKHSTTGDMAEDFGVGMTFAVTDSGATQSLGDLGYTRRGADNTADFILQTYNGGTRAEKFRVLAAGGICFNGDKVAANALDDYEEGGWTPTCSTSAGNGSFNVTVNFAKYIKVGGLVHVSCYLSIVISDAGSGAAQIGGLPFVATSGQGYSVANFVHASAIQAQPTNGFAGYVTNGQAYVRVISVAGAPANIPWVTGNPVYLMMSATYHHV